ncbi:MAG: hypothetical protein RL598_768, partial [Verrucomicrobiota bacterium]
DNGVSSRNVRRSIVDVSTPYERHA